MRSPSYTGQFKRDAKLAEKRGKDMSKLRTVIEWLLTGSSLPRELGDHPLKGGMEGEPRSSYRTRLGADLPRGRRRDSF